MSESENRIEVRMLGGFSITVNGQYMGLGQNNKANFLKLIQIILLNHKKGISKRELIDGVFGYKDLLDENNSLNNLLHQARTQLKKSGVPGKRYIEGKKGIYFPEKPEGYELSLDVKTYMDDCRKAGETEDPASKAALYEHAFELYRGELLPEFSTDNWVIVESVKLKHLYDELVMFLGEYYRNKGDYDSLYKLYNRASQIYPDAGWQINVIDALILRKEYKEAYELYNKTARYYLDDLEVPLPDDLIRCYERIYDDIKVVSDDIEEIQAGILERDAALKNNKGDSRSLGSYYCAFSSFIDVYNVLRRNLVRRGNSIFMMLCTLVDYEGKPIQNQEKLAARSEALKNALYEELRQGDVYTKYSSSQYLLLLIGTKKEDCGIIYHRISKKLKELAGSRAELKYRIVSLAEIPSILESGTGSHKAD
ncbi:bacterial transcriptional activator domain-containing protein [Oribacterium sp. C9]|uniref:bacterial transcriptional activator domain-containing protein n=1 Tax=Oribacterium sp. C9 TaxID=1943579 RepID=UPI00098EEB59|nr:bacterial transcriptional activator domain-containing protein [Oribacterium sp. C9]